MKPTFHVVGTLIFVSCLAPSGLAQQDRVASPIDSGHTAVLDSKVRPLTLAERGDEGLVAPSLKLPWITLWFKRAPIQEAALRQLLAEQRDGSSRNYHNWLGSQEFADQFGLSPDDVGKIAAWLETQGFRVEYLAKDRDFIAFSGTAEEVRNSFRTEIHRYTIGGEPHYMNASAPSIPQALTEVVLSLRGLTDLRPKPVRLRNREAAQSAVGPEQQITGGTHTLAPDDIATIYDIAPLYDRGIDGSGQKIVVVGESKINLSDIRQFRSHYHLPGADPQIIECCGGDPVTFEQFESELDVEMVSAVARNADVIFVYSQFVDDALSYAIDNNLAPVISESFAFCEQAVSNSGGSPGMWESLALTANAKGITWLAATGDSGAAGCDPWFSGDGVAANGLAVNIPASVPEVTAVGGTEFNEGSGSYWSATNGGSAKGYIPEIAWNESSSTYGLASTGGGVSTFYSKPPWQTGPGVPNDGMRDVPDVSMNAALHDSYSVYLSGAWGGYGSGTSASTPVFAGIVVLLNQFLTAAGQRTAGNINPMLYALAHSTTNVFHDIATGDNIVACLVGSSDCAVGSFGYSAWVGYDLATGLGSVDAYNLVTSVGPRNSTAAAVTANPASILTNGQTKLTATVSSAAGSTRPVGSVRFSVGGAVLGSAQLSGASASLTVLGGQLSTGSNVIEVTYSGDLGFSESRSSVLVTVSQPAAGVTFMANPDPIMLNSGSHGMTTLTWDAPGYNQLAIFVGSPTGSSMTGTVGSSGSAPTGNWVTDGVQFFLMDLTTHTAIASVTAHVSTRGSPRSTTTAVTAISPDIFTFVHGQTTLTAAVSAAPGSGTPSGSVTFSVAGAGLGAVTLSDAAASIVVNGSQLSAGMNTIDGAYSGDASFAASSGSVVVVVVEPLSGAAFNANPNPIMSLSGTGITTLTWDAPGHKRLAIFVGSVTGDQMTGAMGSSGFTRTGDWVTDGMQFFLVDLTTHTAIASLIVHVSASETPAP